MEKFNLQAPYTPQGDQPNAIEKLLEGLERGEKTPNIAWCDRDRENIYGFKCRKRNK